MFTFSWVLYQLDPSLSSLRDLPRPESNRSRGIIRRGR